MAVENIHDHRIAVAAHFGDLDRERAHDESAQREPRDQRQLRRHENFFRRLQRPQKPRRRHARDQAERHVGQYLPRGVELERRHLVELRLARQPAHRQRRRDGRHRQRPEALHRDRAENNFRHEKRARDRRVVSRGDARRRAARHQQPQLRWRKLPPPPYERRDDRRELHHRAFAPDRAARADREQCRRALHQAGTDWHMPRADHDGLHVVRRTLPARDAPAEQEHETREQPARRRQREHAPPRQLPHRFDDARVRTRQQIMHALGEALENQRDQRTQSARQRRPQQRDLPLRRLEFFLDPDAPSQQPQPTLQQQLRGIRDRLHRFCARASTARNSASVGAASSAARVPGFLSSRESAATS